MKRKFCPKCGKETEDLYEGLCKDCSISKFSISTQLPDKILIKECKICGKFFTGKSTATSADNAVELFLEGILKQKEIDSVTYRVSGGKVFLTLRLKKDNFDKTEEKELNLMVKKIICQICSMMESGYFQTIIQVRAPENILPEIKEEIYEQISHLNKFDRLAFISKYQEAKNGFDVFIGSKSSANRIANALKAKYRAKIKITKKLSGSIKGKKVYQDTILVSVG